MFDMGKVSCLPCRWALRVRHCRLTAEASTGGGVLIIEDSSARLAAPKTGGAPRRYDGQVNIIGFIISLGLFILGLYVMASAFSVVGYESLVFIGGILLSSIGVAIPIHLFKRIDA